MNIDIAFEISPSQYQKLLIYPYHNLSILELYNLEYGFQTQI